MNQSGKSIQNANLQEFLDSAANATEHGQQQFYTSATLATELFRPLPAHRRHLLMDLHFGSGSLAAAGGATHAIGLDIDSRSAKAAPPEDATWEVATADLTRWYPLAAEIGFTAPFITINPPFSLRWYADRLAPLRKSSIPEVAAAASCYDSHIDSTLASFLIALDLLAPLGEGFIICNADTARRFFGSPNRGLGVPPHTCPTAAGAHSDLRPSTSRPSDTPPPAAHPDLQKFIYLWLELPGLPFEGVERHFPTAVLYFSRSHAQRNYSCRPPLFIPAASTSAPAIQSALCVPEVFTAHLGSRFTYESELRAPHVLGNFRTLTEEYATRHQGKRPAWNIQLDEKGRLRTYLTPFQETSRKLDRNLVAQLHALNGKTPISLCVTATSRTALRAAAECGVWTIQPAVGEAIRAALLEHEKDGAPFYTPNAIQSLGWIDEHGSLRCAKEGLGSFLPGTAYPIATTIERTTWSGHRINLAGEKESLSYTGQELLVKIKDPDDVEHHFHVRRDDAEFPDEIGASGKIYRRHWHIEDLVTHFKIPIPADIVTLHPERYQANVAKLKRIEARIARNVAALSA